MHPNPTLKTLKEKPEDILFTGGVGLTGFEEMVYYVDMKNELVDGKRGYVLSYAKGKSGLSYGGNQMDLANDKIDALPRFRDIIVNARDENNQPFFTDKEIGTIMTLATTHGNAHVLDLYQPRINKALSSDYGRQQIDLAYKETLANRIQKIDGVIAGLPSQYQKGARSEETRLLLIDYDNQYHLTTKDSSKDAKMYHLLHGKQVVFNEKLHPVTLQMPSDHFDIEILKEALHSTKENFEKKGAVMQKRYPPIQETLKAHHSLLPNALDEKTLKDLNHYIELRAAQEKSLQAHNVDLAMKQSEEIRTLAETLKQNPTIQNAGHANGSFHPKSLKALGGYSEICQRQEKGSLEMQDLQAVVQEISKSPKIEKEGLQDLLTKSLALEVKNEGHMTTQKGLYTSNMLALPEMKKAMYVNPRKLYYTVEELGGTQALFEKSLNEELNMQEIQAVGASMQSQMYEMTRQAQRVQGYELSQSRGRSHGRSR